MRRSAVVAAFVALAGMTALPSPLAAQKLRSEEHGRAVTATASIRISGSFGSLRVIGWDRDSLALVALVPYGARFEGNFDDKGPPASGVKMFLEATEVAAAAAKLELRVPTRARVWAKGSVSNIEASGITGGLDLNVVGGSIRVSGNPRELTVESMDGAITVTGAPEWMRLKSATGDITFHGGCVDGGISTISGAIHASGGSVERGKIESVTGPIVFAESPVPGAAIDFNTHSGRIELYIPRKFAEVDAATMTGTIENGYTSIPAITSRDKRGQEIGIGIGNGGPRYYVRSFKGTIVLRALTDFKK
jgi:hypothetical protein